MTTGLWVRLGAEWAGTALLVALGTGSVVAAYGLGGEPQWVLAVAWFGALALPALLFAEISGALFNPAVTLALWVSGRHPSRELLPYAAAQLAGAFSGSAVVLLLLGDHAHLGATLPEPGRLVAAFMAEASFTAVLTASVAWNPGSESLWNRWKPLVPSFVVAAATLLIGPWTGSSMNPARSLAPALLSGTYTNLWLYLVATPWEQSRRCRSFAGSAFPTRSAPGIGRGAEEECRSGESPTYPGSTPAEPLWAPSNLGDVGPVA